MKPTLLQRLKARTLAAKGRLRRGTGAKPRGVAILTVLAIITLMTVLVVSFFNMAQTQQTTAKGSVEMQRVTNLKDTVINLVIAQLREATTLSTLDHTVAWTSQPGAIRTFSNDNANNSRVYKLYSAAVPVLTGIQDGQTSTLLDQILSDVEADWDRRPEEFADLNRPTVNFTLNTNQETDRISPDRLSYPIADPRRYNGQDDPLENTEGFSYKSSVRGKTIRGVDPTKRQLAMPVRWIYVLEDGGLGYLNSSKRFVGLTPNAAPTKENPMVARLAWWTDDESCKINVNTASLPMVWDSPRTTSLEDREHAAKLIPRAGEFQRYPGHPATVDLSAVFYPGRRWVPPTFRDLIPAGESMEPLELEDATRIWDLAPFITSYGTKGGNEVVSQSSRTTEMDERDHLYTSFEELYFRATSAESKSINRARESLLPQDRDRTFLRRLEESPFFLTHKSHAPETTTHGFPRITTVAMDGRAAEIARLGREPSGDVSPYDVTIAVNSTIGGKAYYFVREDAGSRHAEIFDSTPTRKRNAEILRYLKLLSDMEIAGYPELKRLGALNTLAEKYPNPVEGPNRRRFENNSKFNRTLDASDRTQILISMLDYMRTSNLKSGLLNTGSQYDGGNGQAAGVCGCGAPGEDLNGNHVRALWDKDQFNSNKKVIFPRGVGRNAGPAEIIMVANVAFVKGPDDEIVSGAGDRTNMNSMQTMLDPKSRAIWMGEEGAGLTRAMCEIGFIVSGFCPKHGWGPLFPNAGISLGTEERVGTGDPRTQAIASGNQILTNTKVHFPFATQIDGELVPLTVANDAFRREESTSRNVPKGGISAGAGMMGPRTFLERGIAIMRPFVQILPSGAGPVNFTLTPYQVDTKGGPPRRIRLHIADGDAGTYNTLNVVDLDMPPQMFTGLSVPANPTGSLRKQGIEWWQGRQEFPGGATVVMRSMVLPHGDYRLTCTPLRVEPDMFVPHATATGGQYAISTYEPYYKSADRNRRTANGVASYSPYAALIDLPALLNMQRNADPDIPVLPLGNVNPATLANYKLTIDQSWTPPMDTAASQSTFYSSPERRAIFTWGRRDGHGVTPHRGTSDPSDTGDFDTGYGAAPDGPYMNFPDDGDFRSTSNPYYDSLETKVRTAPPPTLSPNLLVRSPVDFGSIPTGINCRVPWQTLRFRPDQGMHQPGLRMTSVSAHPPERRPFANFCGPRDHQFLDLFWMPVVEPWSISEPFSTKGKINLNQQIFPFIYIERTTALWALLRGERMVAIHNDAATKYKSPNNTDKSYRYFINPKETVRQFTLRYDEGAALDPLNVELPFNCFRSASEICELWLVPDKFGNGDQYESEEPWTLEYIIGDPSRDYGFWSKRKLTGDNLRERPYANLYSRVCVRSNVFKVHMITQTLQKATSSDAMTFDPAVDNVTAEWRGSATLERSIDSGDRELNMTQNDFITATTETALMNRKKIDEFYTYRVTEIKQISE